MLRGVSLLVFLACAACAMLSFACANPCDDLCSVVVDRDIACGFYRRPPADAQSRQDAIDGCVQALGSGFSGDACVMTQQQEMSGTCGDVYTLNCATLNLVPGGCVQGGG